jgi:hypothetical protein
MSSDKTINYMQQLGSIVSIEQLPFLENIFALANRERSTIE